MSATEPPGSESSGAGDAEAGAGLDGELIRRVVELLVEAESVLFVTGAGISADSGLPTYRGVGGLYNDDATEDGVPIESALSGPMLQRRPELTWKYIHQIESACRGARPNRAHEIMSALEQHMSRVWVLTQNVDGFHGDAGSTNVIEIHGNIRELVCTRCTWQQTVTSYEDVAVPPKCPYCDALVRPDVVLFGEQLSMRKLSCLRQELARGFDIVFSIGTTSVFPYIAAPVLMASAAGKTTIEINPGSSEVSEVVDYRLRAGARDALESIWRVYCGDPAR